jgi:organic radical activating enzyme
MTNPYCSIKFTELQVELQSRRLYNCCKAYPERVDLDWLEKNPGKLFYTPTMIADRELMLEGERSKSCEFGCYKYEDQGLTSWRQSAEQRQDIKKKISNIYNPLESLTISLSYDCNLTCIYCDSNWSSAWSRDIEKNGQYNIEGYDNKFDSWRILWQKMKQKERSNNSRFFQLLLNEINLSPQLKSISILGGEPFLHNELLEIIEKINDKKIIILSGLGVSLDRLKKIVEVIKNKKNNISLLISAENTKKFFEFVRYGTTWRKFIEHIDYLNENNIKFGFTATISNLTSFDVIPFYEMFNPKHYIKFNPVAGRPFLQPNVLDDQSKQNLLDSMKNKMDDIFFRQVKQSVEQPYKDEERKKLSIFLKEFSNRRKLKLDIFPVHFLKWLELV